MMTTDTNTRKARGDTRLRLITAAEKLFGERGIHGVTLKDINAAAGQRNESALHYHFGSKPALVEAILVLRTRDIDLKRMEMVDALLASGQERNLNAILKVMFLPMMELLGSEKGVRFIRFLAQVLNDPDFDLPDMAIRGSLPGVIKANGLLVAALGDITPEIVIQRQRFIVEMGVSSLAIWSRHHDSVNEVAARELFISNLLDSIAGFLTAPVSEETLDLLKKSIRRKEKK